MKNIGTYRCSQAKSPYRMSSERGEGSIFNLDVVNPLEWEYGPCHNNVDVLVQPFGQKANSKLDCLLNCIIDTICTSISVFSDV